MDRYHVSEEDKSKIRTMFNVTDEHVNVQMKILQEWVKTMPHFPKKCEDEHFLYNMLLRSKFNEETAKIYLENYFKGIIKYANVFKNLGKCKPSEDIGMTVPCPKLTQHFERIVILKFVPRNMKTKDFNLGKAMLGGITTALLLHNYDDAASVRLLIDQKELTMMHLFKINMAMTDMFKLVAIIQNVLKLRISGLEFINTSKLINAALSIIRLVLKPKLFSRITVHSDIASLSKNIPIELLPSDYGGECESTEIMLENWDHVVEAHQSFFETVASWSEVDTPNGT